MDVVRFLIGLKQEYEPIRAQILGSSDLPSLHDVFSRLQQATLCVTDKDNPVSAHQNREPSALVASNNGSVNSCSTRDGRSGCGPSGGGHTRALPKPSGPSSVTSPDIISISREEYNRFVNQQHAAPTSTATLAQLGTTLAYLFSSAQNPWVIDFGTTDHD
ncbi:hypothetical protein Ancab_016185 [Ancistrocladus abbreviatus]